MIDLLLQFISTLYSYMYVNANDLPNCHGVSNFNAFCLDSQPKKQKGLVQAHSLLTILPPTPWKNQAWSAVAQW